MPVQKFRTFEEARRALWTTPGDPMILERMKRFGELARSRKARRGVFRYRSIEEAKKEKYAADAAERGADNCVHHQGHEEQDPG